MGHDNYISGAEIDAVLSEPNLRHGPQTSLWPEAPSYIVGDGYKSQDEDPWADGKVPNTMTVTQVDLPFTP